MSKELENVMTNHFEKKTPYRLGVYSDCNCCGVESPYRSFPYQRIDSGSPAYYRYFCICYPYVD